MGLLGKLVSYGGACALGFVLCYKSCVNNDYKVVEENGRVYVEDKDTGRRSRVRDFDIDSRKASKDSGLQKRLDDAYDALTR